MTNHPRTARTAKNARRRFSLTLLGVLGVIAVAGIAWAATSTPSPGSFVLSASPSNQTVNQGQTATYALALHRQNQFVEPVGLSVSNLPANTDVKFWPGPIPGSSSNSSMTIETNVGGTTPTGTRTLTITGTGGGVTSQTTVTLAVVSSSTQNFILTPRPSAQNVTESDTANYSFLISRGGGFTGPVALSASGLPNGASAVFTPNPVPGSATTASLVITTNNSVKPGRYPILVTGLGTSGATQITRATTVALNVEEKKPLSVTSDPVAGLAPGTEKPVDLSLKNSHNFEIQVVEVALALDPHSSEPGCEVSDNFEVEQMAASRYPLSLPADTTLSLSDLGVPESDMPRVRMLNTSFDQEACKGAEISFRHSGTAIKP
jgi:uncharacterized membrane protein